MMGRLWELCLVSFLIVLLLSTESTWAKRGSSSSGRRTSSTSNRGGTHTQSKPSSSQPNRNSNPYPSGGSYPFPGTSNSKPSNPVGGYNPNQNPSRTNPGGYPNQNPGGYPNQNPGGYPNQNPGGGYNPSRTNPGGYPNQNPGGYPNQNPGGGYNPSRTNPGGYPNQNPGGYPNQNPAYPPVVGHPNQNPAYPPVVGYPNQYPGRTNQGGYPNQRSPYQYPAAGGYPNINQRSPYQYPGQGGYPVRTGNTGPGWGQPAAYPGSYPGGAIGGYPNWNPNNRILSPSFGGGGYMPGMGGSPFSRSVKSMGLEPKSSGFAKKAMLAAGVGAVAGMAVGYGLGRFPRPHFSFRNPGEEYYYNNYMYRHYGTQSTDEKDYGRDYVYKVPPRAESYEKFMDRCMNGTEQPKAQGGNSSTRAGAGSEDDDTVSIEEIGYPALIEQVKSRRCVEQYMVYSASFLQKQKAEQQLLNRCGPLSFGLTQLFSSLFMLLSSVLLLQ